MAYRDLAGTGHASIAQVFPRVMSFSPDGIYFVTDGLKIVDMNLQVTSSFNIVGSDPDWSSDGSWIVFRRSAVGGTDCLFVVHPDGSDEKQITTSQYGDLNPVWKR
jgi:Tol biopolymer transport system component